MINLTPHNRLDFSCVNNFLKTPRMLNNGCHSIESLSLILAVKSSTLGRAPSAISPIITINMTKIMCYMRYHKTVSLAYLCLLGGF